MNTMLLKQAAVVPLAAMLIPIFIAFFLPSYSSVSQHISEVALLDHPAATIQRLAAGITGVSICLFAVGLLTTLSPRAPFTALAAALFGVSMISNGVFVMGSPLHGLYGLGFFVVLVPAFFAAELRSASQSRTFPTLSMAVAVATLFYMWLMLSGFDPHGYRGLTQRIATVIIFGWYTLAAGALSWRGLPTVRDGSKARSTVAAG